MFGMTKEEMLTYLAIGLNSLNPNVNVADMIQLLK